MYTPTSISVTNLLTYESLTYDFSSNPILIIGKNLDNPGQERNGSGKSALNESISIALTGKSIRDVRPRELVRRGCPYGEVSLLLSHPRRGELTIRRKLYTSDTKPSEISLEGEGVSKKSSVAEYNKYIYELLGVSEIDLRLFFLVSSGTWNSFFTLPDKEKKAVINRFSGGSIIEPTFPYIQSLATAAERDLQDILRLYNQKQGAFELLSKQVEELSTPKDLESIYRSLLDLKAKNLESAKEKAAQLKLSLDELESTRIAPPSPDIPSKLEIEKVYQEDLRSLQLLVKQYNDDLLRSISQLGVLNTNDAIVHIESLLKEGKSELSGLQREEANSKQSLNLLISKIKGGVICPNCNHKFLIGEEVSIESLESQVTELTSTIQELGEVISELQLFIREHEVELGGEKEKLDNERKDLQERNNQLRKLVSNTQLDIQKLEGEYQSKLQIWSKYESEQKNFDLQIQSLRSQLEIAKTNCKEIESQVIEYPVDTTLLEKEKKEGELVQLGFEVIDLEKKVQMKRDELGRLVGWQDKFKLFRTYISNLSVKSIEDYTNSFLGRMGSDISVRISTTRGLTSGDTRDELQIMIERDGFDIGSYGSFSSGERVRIDVACILAMQELINLQASQTGGGLNFLSIDEVCDAMDSRGLVLLLKSLRGLGKMIYLISQNEVNIPEKGSTLLITKQNGVSTLSIL